jgi:hypothetical protein
MGTIRSTYLSSDTPDRFTATAPLCTAKEVTDP